MATRKAALFEVVPLQDVPPARLRDLLVAEHDSWLRGMLWDSADAVDLTLRAIARSLITGAVVRRGSRHVAFLAVQPSPVLARLCGALAPPDLEPAEAGSLVAETMRTVPPTARVEGQVAAFEAQDVLDEAFREADFDIELRAALVRDILPPLPRPDAHVTTLRREHVESCARVLVEAHANSVEARINAAFQSLRSANEYLSDLIASHGCGSPVTPACVVALRQGSVVGFSLGTVIAPGIGHVPQIAVEPAAQGDGVGAAMLAATFGGLHGAGCTRVTLSVSLANERAEAWYRRAGFSVLTRFSAHVRQAPSLGRAGGTG